MTYIEMAAKLVSNDLTHVLEFGVYNGGTISVLRNALNESFEVFGFDSFEGLPEDWDCPDGSVAGGGVCKKGFFSTNGKVPQIEGVTFFKGWFEDTLPTYLNVAKPIGILHVDCDLYSSTKTVLYGLNDFIVAGTIIVFDEWIFMGDGVSHDNHEQKCFYEWVKDCDRECEFMDNLYGEEDEQKIVRITK